jgi:hypothetical protein
MEPLVASSTNFNHGWRARWRRERPKKLKEELSWWRWATRPQGTNDRNIKLQKYKIEETLSQSMPIRKCDKFTHSTSTLSLKCRSSMVSDMETIWLSCTNEFNLLQMSKLQENTNNSRILQQPWLTRLLPNFNIHNYFSMPPRATISCLASTTRSYCGLFSIVLMKMQGQWHKRN